MILIADSGSTKTDWYLIRKDHPDILLQTIGLNPYFVKSPDVEEVLLKELAPFFYFEYVDYLYFYGAGCGSVANREMLGDIFGNHFTKAGIEVNTDILGTARAMFGTGSGIACILGTGSNSCFYSNGAIEYQNPSLGYILGDEGSGVDMGKRLLKAFIGGELPENIKEAFEKKYQLNYQYIIEAIYRHPQPNAFLAKFSHFIEDHLADVFMKELVKTSFQSFFKWELTKYKNYQSAAIGFGGSIAYVFSDILYQVAGDNGVVISQLLQSPMQGLVQYHMPAGWI